MWSLSLVPLKYSSGSPCKRFAALRKFYCLLECFDKLTEKLLAFKG